jgi:alcohol dehydrogenase class IV
MALIQYINRVQFGAGALAELPAELALAGINRPLVVTDAGVVAAGLLERLLALLPSGVAVHATVPPNPNEAAAAGPAGGDLPPGDRGCRLPPRPCQHRRAC